MNINFPNRLLRDLAISDLDVQIYGHLQLYCFHPVYDSHLISLENLTYAIGDTSLAMTRSISSAMNRIILSEYINGTKLRKGVYVINHSAFDYKGMNGYVKIDHEDFLKIKDSFTLRLYALILNSRNFNISISGKNGIISTQVLAHFAKLLECNEKTISRHIQKLEDKKILYVHRGSLEDGHSVNYYGKYEDKELIDEYAKSHSINIGETSANNNRRLAQRYNRLVKLEDAAGYSTEEIREIYEYVRHYNNIQRKNAKGYNDDRHLANLKDEGIFYYYLPELNRDLFAG